MTVSGAALFMPPPPINQGSTINGAGEAGSTRSNSNAVSKKEMSQIMQKEQSISDFDINNCVFYC